MKHRFRKVAALWAGVVVIAVATMVAVMAQPADTPVNPFAHDPAAVAAGQKVFNSTCTACHGEGATGGRGPALNTGRFTHGSGDYDLFQTIRSGVAGTQMPSFAALPADDVWRAVTYIKSLSGRSGGNEVASGNAAAGEALFFGAGHCASCHEVNGKGAAIAADLSDEGTKPLGAIRNGVAHKTPPGFRAPPHFADVTTSDGRKVHGFVTAEDSFAIALNVDGKSVVFDKKNIRDIAATRDAVPHDVSLTSAQAEDVVAYLAQQKKRDFAQTSKAVPAPVLSTQRLVNSRAEPQNYLSYWGGYDGHH